MSRTRKLVLFHPCYKTDDRGFNLIPQVIGYGVATVSNSTEYRPGQFLSKAEVKDLCELGAWEVTVRARTEKDIQR
jgi:hypothetical protein